MLDTLLITLAKRYSLITFYLMGFKLCMIRKYNREIMLVMLFFLLRSILLREITGFLMQEQGHTWELCFSHFILNMS